jgi:sigma-B regulation protein RsbU (phosphoserine phosphatase)
MDCTMKKSKFVSLLRSRTYDVILSDVQCPNFDAFEALRFSIDICPHVPFICVSGSVGEETAIELKKQGAVDYVVKDRMVSLVLTIERARNKAKESTLRQQAEETLRQSEERYQTLVTFSPDALYVQIDSRITFANPGFCRLLGADDPSQLIGKSVFEIVHPQYHEKVRERWTLMSGGQPAPLLEEKFIRLDGTVVDVEVNAVAIDWQGSKAVQVNARNITERKRAAESQLLLTTALESTANGVLITDVQGNIVWVNRAFTGMTGYTQTEVLGKNPRILNSGKQEGSLYKVLWDTISAGNVWRGELINKKKDGSLYVEEMTITPLKNTNGEIASFIAVKQDITERKHAEEELRYERGLLRTLIDNLPDAIFVKDSACRKTIANLADVHNMGRDSEAEVLGKNDFDLFPADVASAFFADDRSVIETGRPVLNREVRLPG